ncbi:hypothetical protein F4827_007089 [Paraburkholderia bannensis]|uniref:Uncharacterized protein n=1 Tax=Paraburkholderia bannensis TaxID=765414 RepID=A0A7W9U559_9BURK|nr:hypothetical protein [Paraburkholderia sp. WP4_3_2]MBB6107207.1 hypothetical protein [Paraburkholderia bannensis]
MNALGQGNVLPVCSPYLAIPKGPVADRLSHEASVVAKAKDHFGSGRVGPFFKLMA